MAPLLVALPLALLGCGGDEPARTASGVTTATPIPRSTEAPAATTPTPAASPSPAAARTAAPPREGTPTEAERALATLSGDNAGVLAGVLEFLDERCSDDRDALGGFAEQTWNILNGRNVRVPPSAIAARVVASLPLDGRTVACESLFASVVVELSRQ